ncbi:MAG: preprotein translocase subunit SecE [Candidatus Eisenbacteria bacterium]
MSAMDKIKVFVGEVRTEMKKITWPPLSELRESTTVVIVSVLIITLFIAIIDFILNNVLNLLIRLGS